MELKAPLSSFLEGHHITVRLLINVNSFVVMKVNMLNKTTKNISDDSHLHITLINRYKSRIVTQQRT